MKHSQQTDLFDGLELDVPKGVVTISLVAGRIHQNQRIFNQLTEEICKKRALLEHWNQFAGIFQARIDNELRPGILAVRAAQRRLLLLLDRLLAAPDKAAKLNKKRRNRVQHFIEDLSQLLLSEADDPEVAEIFERYSGTSLEEQKQIDLEMAEVFLQGVYGRGAVQNHAATNFEELVQHAQKHAQAKAQAKAERRANNGRLNAAQTKKAQAEQETTQSLREIFRQLVSHLHPDRESDPTERARKTELMQRINVAYKEQNLLDLLTLQMEVEQISLKSLASIPSERLKHYNGVLRGQLRTLEQELRDHQARYQAILTPGPRDPMETPIHVEILFERRKRETAQVSAAIDADCAALADPTARNQVIDSLIS